MNLSEALLSYFNGKASFDDVVTFALRSEIQPPGKAEYITLLNVYGNEKGIDEEIQAKSIKIALLFNERRRDLLTKSYNKNVPKSAAIQTILRAFEDADTVHEWPCRCDEKCSVSGRKINGNSGTELAIDNSTKSTVFFLKNSRRKFFKDWFVLRHADDQMRLVYAWASLSGPLEPNALVDAEYERLVDAWRAINNYVSY